MKKLTIVLLSVFFIGIANINAQTDVTTENVVAVEEVKKECPFTKNAEGKLVCVKTGKICDYACKNKAKGTCCKGKKKTSCSKSKKSSCSKSKEGGFNFNKSNNYGGGKSSCSKKAKSSCSKGATAKKCCKKKIVKKCGADCTKSCCNGEARMSAMKERIRIGIINGTITEEEGKTRIARMKSRMKEKTKEE